MSKKGLKGLKIAGIVLAILLVLLITIPFLFKGTIKEAVINIANKKLNAELKVEDFGMNLFSNFPNATLSLNNVSLSGVGDFEGDTLVKAKSASVALNLIGVFKGDYTITKIDLDEVDLYAKVLADGRANWDIVKADSTEVEEESSPFSLSLKKISINDCDITYDDRQGGMKAVIKGWNGTVSGDFTASTTTIKTESVIDELSFIMDGIPLLNKIKTTANAKLDADLDNMKFAFEESSLQMNEVKASIDGSVGMVGEDGMDFDLKLQAPETQFKDILSILPAMYTEDFKDIKTAGSVSLSAFVKGLMEGETYPAFDVKLAVKDAMFQYPSLPKSVNDINVDMSIASKGGSLDNMMIDISKFKMNMGGNPFNASLNVKTPMSDPDLKAHLDGMIDLGIVKDVYPLEKGTEMNGKLTANLNIATRLSAIEREQYQNVSASGNLKLTNMIYKSPDMPEVTINDAGLDFTPQFVNLSSLNVKIGKNDLAATGRLGNFIAYMLKDQTLKGNLNINSNYFNLNDFMGGETTAEEASSSTESVVIPKNVNFLLNASMNEVVYEKVNITNLKGTISVKDGVVSMTDVGGNALGGSCKVNGSYNTSNPTSPKVDLALALSKVSFSETFKSVESIQKFAPIFDKLMGNYSMNLSFNTTMGDNIMQMLSSLTGSGAISTSEVKVEGVEALSALSSALKSNALNSFTAKDVNIPFSINDGKISTKPFSFNFAGDGKLSLEGSTSLDQTINYKGTIALPKALSNDIVKNVGLTIGGTFTNPKVSVDAASLVSEAANTAAEKLLGGSLDDKKEELTNKLSEEKAKQAQKLRSEAKAASDKLVSEAQTQGQKLVDASKNAIAKAAAQAAANKLVDEAKKQGQKLVDEAEVQAKKLEGE
ncbi:AsmA family protein [Dysgonomonas sp. 520]|uniref:AsmA family protein n=1 Tax=Dysgonomonas sp. 520 TaxID=2302931 RepID=UPI0013D38CAB|nr:AsmA family protein [Dysgonomonas sp. 520]NDW11118.1 AsmA family protein [Dysgonomonas sp. 520]